MWIGSGTDGCSRAAFREPCGVGLQASALNFVLICKAFNCTADQSSPAEFIQPAVCVLFRIPAVAVSWGFLKRTSDYLSNFGWGIAHAGHTTEYDPTRAATTLLHSFVLNQHGTLLIRESNVSPDFAF